MRFDQSKKRFNLVKVIVLLTFFILTTQVSTLWAQSNKYSESLYNHLNHLSASQVLPSQDIDILISLDLDLNTLLSPKQIQAGQAELMQELLSRDIELKAIKHFQYAPIVYAKITTQELYKLDEISIIRAIDLNHENKATLSSSLPFVGADQIHATAA